MTPEGGQASGDRPAKEAPIDRVVLVGPDGAERPLDLEAFFAFPLNVRVRHFLERTVRFYKGGAEVNLQHALSELRKRKER